MRGKEDKTVRDNHAFESKSWTYMEFAEALVALEPLSKKNVVIRDSPNRLWMSSYLFMMDASNVRWRPSEYELFFTLRRYGNVMVKNARKEIREDLAKIVELAKGIKRYDDSLKECEMVEHNAEILIKLQEVITPYLVAQKLSE